MIDTVQIACVRAVSFKIKKPKQNEGGSAFPREMLLVRSKAGSRVAWLWVDVASGDSAVMRGDGSMKGWGVGREEKPTLQKEVEGEGEVNLKEKNWKKSASSTLT